VAAGPVRLAADRNRDRGAAPTTGVRHDDPQCTRDKRMKAIRNRCSRDHGLRGRDARNCRLGIADWGFEDERRARFGRTLCQTNPISPFSGLKTGSRLQNKANLDDWGLGIAYWGFATAACGCSAARCAKQSQSATFGYIVGGFGGGRTVRLEIGGTRYEIRFTRYASTV
jgi:hypothetical protein